MTTVNKERITVNSDGEIEIETPTQFYKDFVAAREKRILEDSSSSLQNKIQKIDQIRSNKKGILEDSSSLKKDSPSFHHQLSRKSIF
jgi:CMP-N-acetylneuraminic acid synthetase